MTKIIFAVTVLTALCAPASAQERMKVKSEESLFLDMHKIGLGSLNEFDEKKKFFETVRLEKMKIQESMLSNVYENAFEYYRAGKYDDAKDLASKILAIDPNFDDATMLLEASNQLRGALRPGISEKLIGKQLLTNQLSRYWNS